MSAPVRPRTRVSPPAIWRPRTGLRYVAEVIEHTDGLWEEAGITFTSDNCTIGGIWRPCCTPEYDPAAVKNLPGRPILEADPFTVYDGILCYIGQVPNPSAVARYRLDGSLSRQLESAFSSGPQHPNLKDATIVSDGTGVSPQVALTLLEREFSKIYNYGGIIHAPSWTWPYIGEWGIFDNDGVHQTRTGHRWSFGTGYSGEGPEGTEPLTGLQYWMYITGPAVIHLGPVHVFAVPGKDGCELAVAERSALIAIDCPGTYAVRVDPCACDCGTPTPAPTP